uniref:Elongation of fatty acids protein n=1 Tax=Calcidiscus leptoporus TaxID=127549 RepID=A0A7S0P4M0_9EUKA
MCVRSPSVAQRVLALRTAHNVLLSLYSAIAAAAAIHSLALRPFSVHGLLCEPAEPAPLLVTTWYFSKFVEWFDSSLLLAAGKPLSSLHYNHHLTTATVVASHFVGRAVRTSIFDIPLLLNAAVHTLMYAYYWRPALLRPVKRLITRLQITQHMSVLLSILYTTATRMSRAGECDISVFANVLSLGLYGMYLVQFMSFHLRNYGKEQRRSTKAE